MKKSKFSVRVLAEIAIFAAIAVALDLLQGAFFKGIWANGGSIGIAMVPIFVIAYRRGLLPGILCGLVVSCVSMMGGIYVIQGATFDNAFMQAMGPFFQIMLDYVLAYTVAGFAGAFAGLYAKADSKKMKVIWVVVGCVVGGLLKTVCHVLSGGFFWLTGYSTFAGFDSTTWTYSIVYNITYCLPNTAICAIIMGLVAGFYPAILNPNAAKETEEDSVTDENVKEAD